MKNFIDMPLVIFFCLILICNYPAHGQSRSEAEGLAKCAAVFHLMTALSEVNPPVGKQYSTYGRLASDMADLYIKPLSGHKNSRQALQNMKSSWMEKLARQRVKTIDPILISCTFWAHNLLLHIKKNISVLDSKNKHKIKEMFRAGPTPDVVYESGGIKHAAKRKEIISEAIRLWKEHGSLTPNKFSEILKNKLRKN